MRFTLEQFENSRNIYNGQLTTYDQLLACRVLYETEEGKNMCLYSTAKDFFKLLYLNSEDDRLFRSTYVNFLDFLENEKNIPIDSLTFSLFTVYSYIFSSIGESFYKELKDRFDKPKIFSEGFRFYSLGDLLLGMFDICLEFSKRLNEKRISSLIMNISNVGVSFYNDSSSFGNFRLRGYDDGLLY
jgi:hypothetical protein